MTTMNNYMGDELAHKVKILSQALTHAQSIIKTLEEENQLLNNALMGLATDNDKDPVLDSEFLCV